MHRRVFVGVLATGIMSLASRALAQGPPPGRGPRWAEQAEKDFRLGRGMGPKLMTEDEWKAHQEKMRTLKGEERERYRREVHEKMMERAKERGITPPPGSSAGPKG
jgi:hypothetical protein